MIDGLRTRFAFEAVARVAVAALFMTLSTGPAKAQTRTIPFSIAESISGVTIVLPGELTATKDSTSEPLQLQATIVLSNFFSKVNAIVDSIGVQHAISGGVAVTHKGTGLSISDGKLHAKVHVKLNWKGRILGIKSSATTDGSITISAQPVIDQNKIKLSVEVNNPAISNDIIRNVADFVEGRETAQMLAQQFLEQKLSDPKASLPLPPEVTALGLSLTAARFEMKGEVPIAVIEGKLNNLAAQWLFR